MTIKGGSSHACAACKYQRRKCSSDCLLAAFFPSDNPKIFQNAHKLFGVKNILKVIKPLDQFHRWEAMVSIIYQSNMRAEFPVQGCCEVIARLEYQIRVAQEELNSVLAQLSMVNPGPSDHPLPILPTETNHLYPNSTVVDIGSIYPGKDDMVSSYCVQNPDTNGDGNADGENILELMQSQMINRQEVTTIQQQEVQEYDEIHPFFDTVDDRQSFVHSKEGNDSSSDSSLKYTALPLEFVTDNELKNAAAHFSLTSVN